MRTYAQWSPTLNDARGLGLPDRQSWIVAPVIQTRDSDPLDVSNFVSALCILGGQSDSVEIHRFKHWGPGWFEIILVAPDREADVKRIADRLADYPILDEDDFARREDDDAQRAWESMGLRDRVYICQRARVSIFRARDTLYPFDCAEYLTP